MSPVHIHLLLNHVPILSVLFGTAVLLYGLLCQRADGVRIGLGTLVIAALVAVPVYLTGDGAEETVEDLSGVSEALIEEHEEAAEAGLIGAGVLGAMAALSLFAGRRQPRRVGPLRWAVAVGGLAAFGWLAYVGSLGGQIRHTEIRGDLGVGVSPSPETNLERMSPVDSP
jgi:hypothetical protein